MEVWRTNSSSVKMNDWTLVVDKGFGDSTNSSSISIGVFKNHLYVASVKEIPIAYIFPMGSELIRIDKYDNWQLIVGNKPIKPTCPKTGIRTTSLSGYSAGFNNPFNIYIWQLKCYDNMLIASTCDHGSNIEITRNFLLLNKDIMINKLGSHIYKMVVDMYNTILCLMNRSNYPRGFDLFASYDGIHFEPLTVNGFGNDNNYGARILLQSKDDEDLYIGTANPYDGCEVLRTTSCDLFSQRCKVNYNDICKLQYKINEMMKILIYHLEKSRKTNI